MNSVLSILITILFVSIVTLVAVKLNVINKSKALTFVTWNLFLNLPLEYFKLFDSHTRDLGDIWFIFAMGYFFIYEYGEIVIYDKKA
ncbi:hypothetical protein I5514_05660 [Acinetobacter baumannii]|uniref:hypothetical protein n=1 Tax=Acinetobacter baumannii TaxID=470 RepID=UPI001900C7B9|nr:hypothetical protein [Acinetobacter baumannii]MBJ9706878.1 hypothetical protein [Acinetobacter baumannii]